MKKKEENPIRLGADVKRALGNLTDEEIAGFFHYKSRLSYAASSKKPWIENGLSLFFQRVKDNFVLVPKEDVETVGDILDAAETAIDLRQEEKEALDRIKKQFINL